jgi:hypothetical protein
VVPVSYPTQNFARSKCRRRQEEEEEEEEENSYKQEFFHHGRIHTLCIKQNTNVYPKVSGLAAWSENCKWHSSLPLGAIVSLFFESV